MDIDRLQFPSGRSVGNCRKDAKRLSDERGLLLSTARDVVAHANGGSDSWARSIEALKLNLPKPTPLCGVGTMSKADIEVVLAKHPLTRHGYGPSSSAIKELGGRNAALEAGQEDLLADLEGCRKAEYFMKFAVPRKTINYKVGSSYSLKHRAEHLLEVQLTPMPDTYVANGALICAALHMGFDVKGDFGSPNVYINISSRSPAIEWALLRHRHRHGLSRLSLLEIARYNELCMLLAVSPQLKWQ